MTWEITAHSRRRVDVMISYDYYLQHMWPNGGWLPGVSPPPHMTGYAVMTWTWNDLDNLYYDLLAQLIHHCHHGRLCVDYFPVLMFFIDCEA